MTEPTDAGEMQPLADFMKQQLTADQVTQFMNAKTVVHTCASCLKNNWNILIDPMTEFGYLGLIREGGFVVPPPFIPCVLVLCQECGYMKTYAKRSITEYLRTLP
jgi:hypothetical protein